ncbi:hypothetical protein [Virgisporangium aurantiacum]|uniref:Uncharacterized protein n=1 Tax=Virgisporangium aurantiacum TaxID=175570 RepID=A0A8J3ZJ38_9ACTN|nr:hypothetical protein [Virgisporangium aurantiacum]GIJ63877.1 hypothetical protein Vau01_113930 [Virgisporangium aurantiacum]
MNDANSEYGGEEATRFRLSEEDRTAVRVWHKGQAPLDPRYTDKVLLRIVARSLVDGEFRARLLQDTASVLADLDPGLPAGTDFKFLANTPGTLHVLLPPSSQEFGKRASTLGEALQSRTSREALSASVDDADFKDDEVDPPITEPQTDDGGVDDA